MNRDLTLGLLASETLIFLFLVRFKFQKAGLAMHSHTDKKPRAPWVEEKQDIPIKAVCAKALGLQTMWRLT